MSNEFKICPKCESRNIQYKNNRKWFCPDCGFDLYNNVAAAVGVIIQDRDGSVIFERRAKEPRKGFLALPGGFVDQDESAENAAVRECLEETGITPDRITYIASFPNTYEYKNITYKTCDMFFAASFEEGAPSTGDGQFTSSGASKDGGMSTGSASTGDGRSTGTSNTAKDSGTKKNYYCAPSTSASQPTSTGSSTTTGRSTGTAALIIDQMKIQASEVLTLESHKIGSVSDIENLPLAFDSAKKALTEWVKKSAKK